MVPMSKAGSACLFSEQPPSVHRAPVDQHGEFAKGLRCVHSDCDPTGALNSFGNGLQLESRQFLASSR